MVDLCPKAWSTTGWSHVVKSRTNVAERTSALGIVGLLRCGGDSKEMVEQTPPRQLTTKEQTSLRTVHPAYCLWSLELAVLACKL